MSGGTWISILMVGLLLGPVSGIADEGESIYLLPGTWQDESGHDLALQSFVGKPTLIGMTYSQCQMTCPRTIHALKRLQAPLTQAHPGLQIVLVTLDPRTDTPDRLARLKAKWKLPQDSWHFLRGSLPQIHKLARELSIEFMEVDDHIQHSSKLVLLNAQGGINRTYDDWDSIKIQ